MKIYIDGDSCPELGRIERIAQMNDIEMLIFCDNVHDLKSDYGQIIHVDCGRDATDFAIVNRCQKGDIVITHDAGLAAMAMAKGSHCIHYNGLVYSPKNINQLLTNRYFRTRSNNKRTRGIMHFSEKKKNLEKTLNQWIANP